MQGSLYTPLRLSTLAILVVAGLLGGCLPGQTSTPEPASDAGNADAARQGEACSPSEQTGCDAGEKCASLVESVNPWLSRTRCVPDGDREFGESCTRGEEGDTGYDDCAAGLSCLDGTCESICTIAPNDSCRGANEALGEGSYCTVFVDLFDASTGLCVAGCDPADDNACDEGHGCYLNAERGIASCAAVPPAAEDLAQNADCYGPASGYCYLNGCSPGHTPLLSNKTENADAVLCARYCTPQESYEGTEEGVDGANGNCNAVALAQTGGTSGNSSEHQCRFVQTFYDNTDTMPAQVGMCVPVSPLSGGSWGDCREFDWDGIRTRWDAAVDEGSDPVAAFRNHCLESPADPSNSPVFGRCIGLFRGCVSLSEAEEVLQSPTGGNFWSSRVWISNLGVDRPTLSGQVPWAWRSQN